MRVLLIVLLFLAGGAPALAIEPSERLTDPTQEARARDIGRQLRCLVCQNQSIDDSNAPLARDLRRVVRQRILAGDSDAQVIAFVHARYGDFVLLRPPVRPGTWLLWFGPAALLVIAGGFLALRAVRRRRVVTTPTALSDAERQRLKDILPDDTKGAGR